MKKTKISIITILALSLLLTTACGEKSRDELLDEEIKALMDTLPEVKEIAGESNRKTIDIAVLLPISGEFMSIGTSILNGLKMAEKKIESSNLLEGKKLNLLIKDISCDGDSNLKLITKEITLLDIPVIIDGTCPSDSKKIKEFSELSNIVDIRLFPDFSKEFDTKSVFKFYPNEEKYIEKFLEFINDLDYKNITIVNDYNDLEATIWDKLVIKLGENNIKINTLKFEENDEKFISKIKGIESDVLLVLSENPTTMGKMIIKISDQNIGIPILANSTLGNKNILKTIGLGTDKIVVFKTFFQKHARLNKFLKEYEVKNKKESLYPFFSANAHDSLEILAETINMVGYNRDAIKGYLYGKKNENKLIGTIDFNKDAYINDLEVGIYLKEGEILKEYLSKKQLSKTTDKVLPISDLVEEEIEKNEKEDEELLIIEEAEIEEETEINSIIIIE